MGIALAVTEGLQSASGSRGSLAVRLPSVPCKSADFEDRRACVPRAHVSVRPATDDDLPALVDLWQELRDVSPRRPRAPHTADSALERMRSVIYDPACRVVVAVLDDVPVGMAVLSR